MCLTLLMPCLVTGPFRCCFLVHYCVFNLDSARDLLHNRDIPNVIFVSQTYRVRFQSRSCAVSSFTTLCNIQTALVSYYLTRLGHLVIVQRFILVTHLSRVWSVLFQFEPVFFTRRLKNVPSSYSLLLSI